MVHTRELDTPIGTLTVAGRDGRVCLVHFGAADDHVSRWIRKWYPEEAVERHDDPGGAIASLEAYFAGELDALDSIAVEMKGTPFQLRTWTALRSVPAGQTATYAQIARMIEAPSAVRAVGAANGANPIAVIVPCHRIIGSNGSLTGYGGGLERKQWLIRHEQRQGQLVELATARVPHAYSGDPATRLAGPNSL